LTTENNPQHLNATEKAEKVEQLPKERNRTPFQDRIKPGMFVRRVQSVFKLEGGDIVMIMSPSRREDFAEGGDGRQFICADVGPSVMTDAYELFVASQVTYNVKEMEGEVLMEYDFATRYYYMDL